MEQDVTRKCIVSGELKSKNDLLRFVVMENQLVPDFQKKLPGKGVYVTNSKEMLKSAVEKRLFSKAVRKNLREEMEICDIAEKLLKDRGLNFINLARKAGAVVSGFEKVREKILHNQVAFVVEALDAGADGHEKMKQLTKQIPLFELYNSGELDEALNKVNTVHIAFLKGAMAQSALSEFERITAFFSGI